MQSRCSWLYLCFCPYAEAALNGIKDIVVKHPTELKLHKVAIIEKLQERICDTDKVVRESLYNILQSLVLPSLKEVFSPFYQIAGWPRNILIKFVFLPAACIVTIQFYVKDLVTINLALVKSSPLTTVWCLLGYHICKYIIELLLLFSVHPKHHPSLA
jgi:hypothetical protein